MVSSLLIACAGGKSGGHIIPCLTIAAQQFPNHQIIFFSANTQLDHNIIAKQPQVIHHIPLQFGSSVYRGIVGKARMLWQATIAQLQSFYYLIRYRPQAVISSGGATSVPVCCAAWVLRIPIHLYELNAVPGKATLFLAKFATAINVCFPTAQKYFNAQKTTVVDYPVRFIENDKKISQKESQTQLHLETNKKTIFILGGSQGSTFLNTFIIEWLRKNPHLHTNVQIIHQTGATEIAQWHNVYKKLDMLAHIFAYSANMAIYYNAADVIVCRAGAGTLFELIYFNKPSIVIPLETATTSHQKDNAIALQAMHPELVQVILQKDVEKMSAALYNITQRIKNP